jgi:hypothetical protein
VTTDEWGPLIAVELGYMLMLETVIALTHPAAEAPEQMKALRRAWSRILGEHGYKPNVALADQIDMDRYDEDYMEMIDLLHELRATIPEPVSILV